MSLSKEQIQAIANGHHVGGNWVVRDGDLYIQEARDIIPLLCKQLIEVMEERDRLAKATEKIDHAMKQGGFGHAIWCNFKIGKTERCNCGISDCMTASNQLKEATHDREKRS